MAEQTGIHASFESNECGNNDHNNCAEMYEGIGIHAKCTCSCHKGILG